MKKSFRILLGLVSILGAVLLIGCANDDDNNDDSSSSTTTELEGAWRWDDEYPTDLVQSN